MYSLLLQFYLIIQKHRANCLKQIKKKKLKRKKLKMLYFKVKASQKYLQVNRKKGMFHAGLKPHF